MKKLLVMLSSLALTFTLVACGDSESSDTGVSGAIDVVSREDGSGARGAFEELVGFAQKDETDQIVDPLTSNATIKDGNGVVATHVRENESSIGYVTFLTLEDSEGELKGLTVNGVEPTIDNVLSQEYPLVRPFNMVYMDENLSDVEKAFIDFSQSAEGAEVIEIGGGIVDNTASFDAAAYGDLSGNLVLGGSTSVESVAKALANEFTALFPNVTYTYDATGSTAGVTNAINGTYTIGFASRNIKDSELEQGITVDEVCIDGIAVVVNPANTETDITVDELKGVYTGTMTEWSELAK